MRSPDNALEVDQLTRVFDVSAPWLNRVIDRKPKRYLRAVQDVTFTVQKGKCLALVGESGCGKSTVARLVTGLYDPSEGAIVFAPAEKGANRGKPLEAQMIFQDPHASLNPRWRVGRIVAEPMLALKLVEDVSQAEAETAKLLELVGLSREDMGRFPHEFSGGQRQRIAIARALAAKAEFIVCDEPTSALDVSVQAQILNLMRDLQKELSLTYVLISHNLAVVRYMADMIGVMHYGKMVEMQPPSLLFAAPKDDYTRMLIDAVPQMSAAVRRSASGTN